MSNQDICEKYEANSRILAAGHYINDSQKGKKPNNNDLIIGPSGAGKTRGYVKPNLLQYALNGSASLVIADTKGALVEEIGPVLATHGYKIININLIDPVNNSIGYNPFDFIRFDERTMSYSESEITTIATCLSPIQDKAEPFWDLSARSFLKAFIAYVMEGLREEEHTPEAVAALYMRSDETIKDEYASYDPRNERVLDETLFEELERLKPGCMAHRYFRLAKQICLAEKAYSSIKGFLSNNLEPLMSYGARRLCCLKERIDFREIATKKTALFLTVSDSDPALYPLANLFYSQAIQELMKLADASKEGRLPIPVRIILDDFATNVVIPNFDRLIAVIRSRGISVSVILQSISQLSTIYNENEAKTIINNCDNLLYLGGQDEDTIRFISKKANKVYSNIHNMALDRAWLFIRGRAASPVKQYVFTDHPLYAETPEFMGITASMVKRRGGEEGEGMGAPRLKERIRRTLDGGDPYDDYYFFSNTSANAGRVNNKEDFDEVYIDPADDPWALDGLWADEGTFDED